jgi:hypothetical protein
VGCHAARERDQHASGAPRSAGCDERRVAEQQVGEHVSDEYQRGSDDGQPRTNPTDGRRQPNLGAQRIRPRFDAACRADVRDHAFEIVQVAREATGEAIGGLNVSGALGQQSRVTRMPTGVFRGYVPCRADPQPPPGWRGHVARRAFSQACSAS